MNLVQINQCSAESPDYLTLVLTGNQLDWLMRDDETGEFYRFRQNGPAFTLERISHGDARAALDAVEAHSS